MLAGADGLDALRVIVAGAGDWLVAGGWLVTEIGADQGHAVAALYVGAGFAGRRRPSADRVARPSASRVVIGRT